MATTKNEIRQWFVEGVNDKKAFMAVWCDTYDYEDYPSYYDNAAEAQRAINSPGSMQKVMEVYSLTEDHQERERQLNLHRCWALRPGDPVPDAANVAKDMVKAGLAYQSPDGKYHLTEAHKETLASLGIKTGE